jgi:hypothetical protein
MFVVTFSNWWFICNHGGALQDIRMCEVNNNTELTDRFVVHLVNIENKASLEAKLKTYYSDGSGYTLA